MFSFLVPVNALLSRQDLVTHVALKSLPLDAMILLFVHFQIINRRKTLVTDVTWVVNALMHIVDVTVE